MEDCCLRGSSQHSDSRIRQQQDVEPVYLLEIYNRSEHKVLKVIAKEQNNVNVTSPYDIDLFFSHGMPKRYAIKRFYTHCRILVIKPHRPLPLDRFPRHIWEF